MLNHAAIHQKWEAMKMCNAEIIQSECILRGITEEIHTFAKWKSLGFTVRKGEKSTIKFPIWKYTKSKIDDETGEEKAGHAFMKMSAFFLASQVQPIIDG